MRRSKNDSQWKELKQKVLARDKNSCVLRKILTPLEAMLLIKKAGSRLNILDPAHVFPVSTCPHMCYMLENVVILNRYSHSMLDNGCDPITGDFIGQEKVQEWWKRIVGEKIYNTLFEISLRRDKYE